MKNAVPRGYIKCKGPVTKEQADALKHEWIQAMSNGRTPILARDVDFIPLPSPETKKHKKVNRNF